MNNVLNIVCVVTLTFLTSCDIAAMQAQATVIQKYAELARQNPAKVTLGFAFVGAGVYLAYRTIKGSTSLVPSPTTPPAVAAAPIAPDSVVAKPTEPSSAFIASTTSNSSSSSSASSSSISSDPTMQEPSTSVGVAASAPSSAIAPTHARFSITSSSSSSASHEITAPKIDFLNPTMNVSALDLALQEVKACDIHRRLHKGGFGEIFPSSVNIHSTLTVLQALTTFGRYFDDYCILTEDTAETIIPRKSDFIKCIAPEEASADDVKALLKLIALYSPYPLTISAGFDIAHYNVMLMNERNKEQADSTIIAEYEGQIKSMQETLCRVLPDRKAFYDYRASSH